MSIRSSLTFIARLWSRDGAHATTAPRERLLYALIVVAIALAAGPEYYAAVELTTLLELLGATLFLTAYAAAARLALASVLQATYGLMVPSLARGVLRSEVPGRYKLWASTYIAFNALRWMAVAFVCGASVKELTVFVA